MCAGAALAACTSAGTTKTATLSTTSTEAYPMLPEEMLTVPAAMSADGVTGGVFAEASVLKPAAPQTALAAAGQQPASAQASQTTAGTQIAGTLPAQGETAVPAQQAVASAATADEQQAAMAMPAAFAGDSPSRSLMVTAAVAPQPAADGSIAPPEGRMGPGYVAPRSAELDSLIARYASYYKVPVDLVRRTVKRESTFNPGARNGPYLGLMQISHRTAQGMGYRGPASGLLDAETNLKYAVRYLRGAWLVARGDHARADRLYQTGYYYDAKRMGLLDETGLGKDRRRRSRPIPSQTELNAAPIASQTVLTSGPL